MGHWVSQTEQKMATAQFLFLLLSCHYSVGWLVSIKVECYNPGVSVWRRMWLLCWKPLQTRRLCHFSGFYFSLSVQKGFLNLPSASEPPSLLHGQHLGVGGKPLSSCRCFFAFLPYGHGHLHPPGEGIRIRTRTRTSFTGFCRRTRNLFVFGVATSLKQKLN